MKTFYYSTEAQTEILFARNKRDLSLDDLTIHVGNRVGYDYELISSAGFRMATMTSENLASKIKSWCVKNGYRCSGVRQFEQFKTGAL
jgi:hypothetical protein